MFPSIDDTEAFKSEFGTESVIERLEIPHLERRGTRVVAVITPAKTKEATLVSAWRLVRALADYLLRHSAALPETERYEIIVAWSQSVRRLQGHIFKVAGTLNDIQGIAESADWQTAYPHALRLGWEKDVFDVHSA